MLTESLDVLVPGVYRARDPHCWTSFTLYQDGRVEFVDATDGHIVLWSSRPAGQTLCDPTEWIAHMRQLIASGELVLRGRSVVMNPDAVADTLCVTCRLPLYGEPSCSWCEREAAYKAAIDAVIAPKGAYKVLLASVGNPDFGQDSRRSMPGVPRRTLRVASLADASKACRAYIAHYELGGGNWLGGEVKKDGKVFAQISYNGRAWEPGEYPTPEILFTDEAAS